MNYTKSEAKEYARQNLKGIWAAALMPFRRDDKAMDEDGFLKNVRHWRQNLEIDGVFVSGKQGEFFSMSVEERKRSFELAVEAAGGGHTIMSCSDQNLDVVVDLARHAEAIGSDYIVVHSPILNFLTDIEEAVYEYYRYLSEQVNIAIALWNHPDCGYLMSPELCAHIAELPNIVAIKYSVEREHYARLTEIAGDRILVSTASEAEWLDNIIELGWRLYLCSSPPYLIQTKKDKRMREYTDLAFAGETGRAREVSQSLQPVRDALRSTRPGGKPQSHQKYWQELLGQVGGAVRRPMLELTEAEKAATKAAFDRCGLAL